MKAKKLVFFGGEGVPMIYSWEFKPPLPSLNWSFIGFVIFPNGISWFLLPSAEPHSLGTSEWIPKQPKGSTCSCLKTSQWEMLRTGVCLQSQPLCSAAKRCLFPQQPDPQILA